MTDRGRAWPFVAVVGVLLVATAVITVADPLSRTGSRSGEEPASVGSATGTSDSPTTIDPTGAASTTSATGASSTVPSSAPATAVSTSTSSSSTTEPAPLVHLVFTGDIIPHGPVTRQGDSVGYANLFSPEVASLLAGADVAICHLETPVAGGPSQGYPTFNATSALLDGLVEVGYDGCSTASNHSMDQRAAGAVATVEAMHDAGLAQAGINPDGEIGWALYEARGLRIAHLSWTYGMNGFRNPDDNPTLVGVVDVEAAVSDPSVVDPILVAAAAAAAEADHVIVSIHWGAEYRHEPTAGQRAVAELLASSGDVDLIVGHHAHVIQPAEEVAGVPVAFGLGNFLSNNWTACCPAETRHGVILHAWLRGDDVRLSWTPTEVDRSDFTVVPALPASAEAILDALAPT